MELAGPVSHPLHLSQILKLVWLVEVNSESVAYVALFFRWSTCLLHVCLSSVSTKYNKGPSRSRR